MEVGAGVAAGGDAGFPVLEVSALGNPRRDFTVSAFLPPMFSSSLFLQCLLLSH